MIIILTIIVVDKKIYIFKKPKPKEKSVEVAADDSKELDGSSDGSGSEADADDADDGGDGNEIVVEKEA